MTRTTIAAILDALGRRTGPTALVAALGFPPRLERVRGLPELPRAVRSVFAARRELLCAYVVRCRGRIDVRELRRTARALRDADVTGHQLIIAIEPRAARVVFACDALHDGLRFLFVEPARLRGSDVEALAELMPVPDESDTAAALRITRALDRSRASQRFFRDVAASRDLVARQWTGLPRGARAERDALALLLLSRLIFLYFLQRRGLLAGELDFLPRLFRSTRGSRTRRTYYTTSLRTLFFGVLNRRPERRAARARRLGELPYLNGGLFERHEAELRRPRLDLPDAAVARVFEDLLEKYRFTASDGEDDDGIDPEMLGRIFEGLMPGEKRSRTGTFYTPARLVERVAHETLTEHLAGACDVPHSTIARMLDGRAMSGAAADVLLRRVRELRVLDPACGSGAFLVGALSALARLRCALGAVTAETARRDVVAHSLYGVDLLADAALICSLRLWLALVPDCERVQDVPPLPNLDRRIRQGDALVDPLDAAGAPGAAAPGALAPLLRALGPAGTEYLGAGPETRPALRRALLELERRVAHAWLDALGATLARQARELHARAGDRDLFGAAAAHAVAAQRQLPAVLRRREELEVFRADVGSARGLPFFSFRVHFAEAERFDVVLSNPPWVRAHNWPPTVRDVLREQYRVCREAGWPYAAELGAGSRAAASQVDLSLLFLERAVGLLAPRGTLGVLLPAKLIRSLYAGGARALALDQLVLLSVEDHSLDHRAAFDADAFTAVLIARRRADAEDTSAVRVTLHRAGAAPLCFVRAAADLPLRAGDAHAPWLLAPPECAAALRTMQQSAPCIAEQRLPLRRGAMTGANDVLLVREVSPKLGDLAAVRADGYHRAASAAQRRSFSAHVEGSTLRVALRGTDVHAWRAHHERHVIWTPVNDDARTAAPPRLLRYLRRHRTALRQPDERLGALHRLNEHTLGHKVVWSDLAADLRAAAVQPLARTACGCELPVVPLNTVYFLATSSHRESLILAAYLNSLPLRTFARAIAERAKDAHFRFFAWTIGMLPLPRDWRAGSRADALARIAASAHEHGAITADAAHRLDTIVADAFGLTASQLEQLAAFDAWLSGVTREAA